MMKKAKPSNEYEECRYCKSVAVVKNGYCTNCEGYNPKTEEEEKLITEMQKKGLPIDVVSFRMYEYKLEFEKMDDDELIDRFNADVGKPGWVAQRGRFHVSIHNELVRRGWDYSAIGDSSSLSWANKIKLVNGKIAKIQ